ncbi:hypothetical protein NZD89_03185 [Alicyclobacillus fastidiosus]|uniref:DUF1453 domain-containing protein n=1 Tax=Alicyclobacillus fastidiosus TaxID=392011 RepID=A0ABY6ZHX2_9BACL|nr:hypothetical protein [Alicyclobacillus fastidiosus]WAH42508.1 hypothetical protein NZD89_03185 [Alicyclobacillus fastidiosus]GMA64348.1 hypothetical protein GCM10025859_47880 [Alicyclobacillus fastidiosus]
MNHYTSVIIIVALVIFGLYRRVRRTVGFQYLVRGRITTRVVIFSILALVILAAGAANPISYVFDAVGLVIGGIIAYISARTTKFEMRNGRWGYLQHLWIGIGLIILFIGRLAFRFIEISQDVGKIQQQQVSGQNQLAAQSFSDPWTAGVFMLLVAYYIGYFIFLLRKAREFENQTSSARKDWDAQ